MAYKDKEKQRVYQLEWTRQRREEWFKKNGPCTDCSTWNNLELDHIDPRIKVSHKVWSWSTERREAELAKCAVRCHLCHVKKTTLQRRDPRNKAHSRTKLSTNDVLGIRQSVKNGEARKIVARRYNVSLSTISGIVLGHTWKWL